MRLIDADAFTHRIKAAGGMVEEELTEDFKDGILAVLEMLKTQPTIEPDQKKGKWIVHPGGKFVGFPYMHYECDQCRDFEPEERNFCPNCGADMRGGEQNG